MYDTNFLTYPLPHLPSYCDTYIQCNTLVFQHQGEVHGVNTSSYDLLSINKHHLPHILSFKLTPPVYTLPGEETKLLHARHRYWKMVNIFQMDTILQLYIKDLHTLPSSPFICKQRLSYMYGHSSQSNSSQMKRPEAAHNTNYSPTATNLSRDKRPTYSSQQ